MTSRASLQRRRVFRPDSRRFLSLLSVGTRALATPLRLFSMTYRQQGREVIWSGGGESKKGLARYARVHAGCLRAFRHGSESPRSKKILRFVWFPIFLALVSRLTASALRSAVKTINLNIYIFSSVSQHFFRGERPGSALLAALNWSRASQV